MVIKIEQVQLRIIGKEGLTFGWNITLKDQNRSRIDIQMYFKSDLDVSSDADIDTLEVKIPQDITIEMQNIYCILKKGTKAVK